MADEEQGVKDGSPAGPRMTDTMLSEYSRILGRRYAEARVDLLEAEARQDNPRSTRVRSSSSSTTVNANTLTVQRAKAEVAGIERLMEEVVDATDGVQVVTFGAFGPRELAG